MNILSRQPKPIPKPARCGFTLVELLFVIAIIAILSTLSLAMIRSSQQEARSSATQSRITHIENILSIYVEELEFRKLPIAWGDLQAFAIANPNGSPARVQATDLRSQILADYMNVEMPQDSSTLQSDPQNIFPSEKFRNQVLSQYGNSIAVPSLNNTNLSLENYLKQYNQTASTYRWAQVKLSEPFPGAVDNQGELLYQLLSMVQFEGQSGLESLGNGALGDSDGDRVMEVVDAWGEPLNFEIKQRTYDNGGNPIGWSNLDFTTLPQFEDFRFNVFSSNPAAPRRVEF